MLHRSLGVDYPGREWGMDWQPDGTEELPAYFHRADAGVSRSRVLAGLLEIGQGMQKRFCLRDTQV